MSTRDGSTAGPPRPAVESAEPDAPRAGAQPVVPDALGRGVESAVADAPARDGAPVVAVPPRLDGVPAVTDAVPDIVIDLTGATPERRVVAPTPGAGPAGIGAAGAGAPPVWARRALTVLGVIAVTAAVLAAVNFANGMQWRAQALAAQERADRAAAEAATLQRAAARAQAQRDAADRRRDAMAAQLAVSETDVAALEARVAALADDQAQAEDYGLRTTMSGPRARMRTLRAQADNCVAQVAALRSGMLVGEPGRSTMQEAAAAAQAACEQVGADAAVLAADE